MVVVIFGLIVAAVMILVGIALIALALLLGWYVRRGERQQPPEPIRPTGAQIRLRADKLHDQGREEPRTEWIPRITQQKAGIPLPPRPRLSAIHLSSLLEGTPSVVMM